jgi:RimJ/RimL family protein N-acetyltransferase
MAIEKWIEEVYKARTPPDINFAVCLKDGDRFIGVVGVDGIDWVNRTGETGSELFDASFRGQGYGTEAKFLLLEYFFDQLHLHVLCSYVFEPNTRSAAALAKQGYRPAGRWKWDDLKDGVYRDVLVFDILREEYLAAKEMWLASRRGKS